MNRSRISGRTLAGTLIVVIAVLGGCGSPATPTSTPTALPSATPSSERVSGEFVISNTTPGGDPVQIETIEVFLEAAPATGNSWAALGVPCSTEPAVPVTFEERLIVSYVCEAGAGVIPADGRLRAVVEATITGSDQEFRMESELAR